MTEVARGLWARLSTILEMIKFAHTLFALPFALLAMMVAARNFEYPGFPGWRVTALVLFCMVTARNAAMAYNRLADRDIDAANPRTASRALPAGILKPSWVGFFVFINSLLFITFAAMLNPLAGWLSPLALFVVLLYSHTKRFTPGSHFVLGLSLAIAPVGAWIAVHGSFAGAPWFLALAVLLWVAGFDIIYSCQDTEFDKQTGLYSLSVTLGEHVALRYAARLHLLMVLAMVIFALTHHMGWIFYLGLALAAWLLIHEHRLVRGGDLSRIDMAFFRVNSVVGLVIFLAGALDVVFG